MSVPVRPRTKRTVAVTSAPRPHVKPKGMNDRPDFPKGRGPPKTAAPGIPASAFAKPAVSLRSRTPPKRTVLSLQRNQ